MDMIAVDPKLFITCRLCLEEMGQYQIIPSVQQQIKYCFDIDVEPFDGLPQLICVKCKDVLASYATTKKNFIEKQSNLKNNLVVKNETSVQPQQDTVSSTQPQQDIASVSHVSEPNPNKRTLQTCSSSDVDTEHSYKVSKLKTNPKPTKKLISWESDYKKVFVCRMCNASWSNKRALISHRRYCDNHHKSIKAKYKNILNKYCTVNIHKLDKKPNITGLSSIVVHNNNTIIHSVNTDFYIRYLKECDPIEYSQKQESCDSSSSEDEDIITKRKPQQRRRLISRSSNETVVIETESKKIVSEEDEARELKSTCPETREQTNGNQCINIDDTDSDELKSKDEESLAVAKQPIKATLADYKTIQGIISICAAKYQKKKDETDKSDKDSKLKHIILSIGRKVISRQGLNCTGILKYMEHKNLAISWAIIRAIPNSKESNLVRILTKLRPKQITNSWELTSFSDNVKVSPQMFAKQYMSNNVPSNSNPLLKNMLEITPVIPSLQVGSLTLVSKNKLLNANPVGNPKQLPKKFVHTPESRSKLASSQKNVVVNDNSLNECNSSVVVIDQHLTHVNSDDSNTYLPIITSTTSLAEPITEERSHVVIESQFTDLKHPFSEPVQTIAPRIKVKPVSELMSDRSFGHLMNEEAARTNLLGQTNAFLPPQNTLNIVMPSLVTCSPMHMVQLPYFTNATTEVNNQPEPAVVAAPPTTTNASEAKDFVILDTVELPNSKTSSPLRYLKTLCQFHNLILLDPNENLSRDFVCLIKFKVVFKQETKDQPVVLCLSMFCNNNKFCLKVRDSSQGPIDAYKISANWQWEILQTYTGEVINKLLQNAQKVSQEMHDLTNKFLCLLKSIKLKKEES